MTEWHRLPFAGFDLESTSTDVQSDRIVTAAVALFRPTPTPPWDIQSREWLVHPQTPIHPKATEVHGITDEFAKLNGREIEEVLPELVRFLADQLQAGFPIVGMNLAFDFSMLHWECKRHGFPTLPEVLGGRIAPLIDTYVLDKQLDRYRKGGRRLEDLCRHYQVRHDGAHNALADVIAAARVAYRIADKEPKLAKMLPNKLHDAQITWRAAQSASFEAYLWDQGKRTDSGERIIIDPCWPVCSNERHTP